MHRFVVQPSEGIVRIRLANCTVWDAVRPLPERGISVDIEGGAVVAIHPTGAEPRGTVDSTRDLRGRYLLPGLWDAHAHLALVPHGDLARRPPLESPIDRAVRAGRTALDALNAG